MSNDFAHLHVHTEYSLLDGYSQITKLVKQAKALGMRHLAITDHGGMYGALEFYKACQAEGIHPVIGVEAYLTNDRHDKSKRFKDDYTHLLLLARTTQGYRNLLKLTTIANTEGMHSTKARIDKEVLKQYGEGVIATSTCLGGEIPQLLLKEKIQEAYTTARWFQEVLGPDNFYLELQEHAGYAEQAIVNRHLYQMHKDLGIALIATNDLHYVTEEDAHSHEVLLCVQTQSTLSNPKRFKFESHEFFLRSPEQMQRLFPDVPDALLNTVRLAERCEIDPFSVIAQLPTYTIPAAYVTQKAYLRALCLEGVREHFGDLTEGIERRLDYEIDLIAQKGFLPYFLIEWDFVNYARSHGIRCSARGSAAGSLMAYTLGITNVDPLRYQLPFERFFNPERADMPDIDMDFPDNRREEVIEYVSRTYGEACVAQMVTFNTMAAKASVKDVARVLGEPEMGERITRLIPTGPKVTLQGSMEGVRELAELYKDSTIAKQIMDQALKLEGVVRSTGVHAAGVIVANEPLEHFVPLQLRDPKDPGKGRITQYEQSHLEELGLIKFDFLGLSNLTILDTAVKCIQQSRQEDVVLEKVPLDPIGDPVQDARREKAFALLAQGETTGIFQLEGAKMTEYIKQLRPTCIEDIMAMIALYRPGPMESIPEFINAKHGRTKITYLDPRLEEWLTESYGVIVYQDQVLFIGVGLAGFSWGKVNKFRKALSKKKMDEVEGYKGDFLKGCVKNGVKQEVAEQLFTLILPFGGYGFNKAHAASYAVVSFYTAYLKANYTAEFMAATMTTEAADAKKIANAVAECKRMGVEVYGPDVNRSAQGFTVEQGGVRFGLLAMKGVGEGPIHEIIQAREQGGPFLSLADFCTRVDAKSVGKGTIETLIKTGAMDAFGKRHHLLASVEMAMKWGKQAREAHLHGLVSLFGEEEGTTNALTFALKTGGEEISRTQLLAWEKELVGIYVSPHPLAYLSELLKERALSTTAQITGELDGKKVTVGGMIKEIRRIPTKKGEMMCVVQLEDMFGTVGITVFPKTYEETTERWVEDAVLLVHGVVQVRRDEPGILCNRVEQITTAEEEMNRKRYQVWLTIALSGSDEYAISNDIMKIQNLHTCLQERAGRDQYELLVENGEWTVRLTPDNNTMAYSTELHQRLETLLGKGRVKVQELDLFAVTA